MTVNDLIQELSKCDGDVPVGIVHASSGNPSHKESAVFPLLATSSEHGVHLVESNYCAGYIPAKFEDDENAREAFGTP